VAESGYPGFSGGAWLGFLAPAGTPAEVIDKVNAAVRHAEADASIRKQLIDIGSRPAADSPAEFSRFIRDEYDQWGKVIKAANIQLDK
jgi:tripartite-type tricarboxylate transporter receptor subunit TctC